MKRGRPRKTPWPEPKPVQPPLPAWMLDPSLLPKRPPAPPKGGAK